MNARVKAQTQTQKEYRRLRQLGWSADHALHAARIRRRFDHLTQLGLVRLACKPDESADIANLVGDSFDPRANPNVSPTRLTRDLAAFTATVEREGVWGLVGEYCTGNTWHHADSCWGFVGDNLHDNGYDTDIMSRTITALRTYIQSRCHVCNRRG